MKITGLRLAMLRIPLVTPFRTALRMVEQVEDVVVMVDTDGGAVGYGSAPATAAITGDTHEDIINSLQQALAPTVQGGDISCMDELLAGVHESGDSGNARAAIEMALYDLAAQKAGLPLYQFLGGGPDTLHTGITISLDTVEKMRADAVRAVADGFRLLKLKVGGDPAEDILRVSEIYRAVGGAVTLCLDANQGWTASEAIEVVSALERTGVPMELVEQPVAAADIDGLCAVAEQVATPVMADESVFTPGDARDLIRLRAASILNIKLMKAQGITAALEIADIAASGGVECMVGCMLESPVSVTAAAHVAAARSRVVKHIDLDAPVLCSENPVRGGAEFSGPEISLGSRPGLGIEGIDSLEYF